MIHGSNSSKKPSILPDRLLLHHSPETSAVLHSKKRQTLMRLQKMYLVPVQLEGKYTVQVQFAQIHMLPKYFWFRTPPKEHGGRL
jgi:hypothetical protein